MKSAQSLVPLTTIDQFPTQRLVTVHQDGDAGKLRDWQQAVKALNGEVYVDIFEVAAIITDVSAREAQLLGVCSLDDVSMVRKAKQPIMSIHACIDFAVRWEKDPRVFKVNQPVCKEVTGPGLDRGHLYGHSNMKQLDVFKCNLVMFLLHKFKEAVPSKVELVEGGGKLNLFGRCVDVRIAIEDLGKELDDVRALHHNGMKV